MASNEILKQNLKTCENDNKNLVETTHDLSLKLEKAKVEISDLLYKNKALTYAKETLGSKLNASECKLTKGESDFAKEAKTLKTALEKEIEASKSLKIKIKALQNEASKLIDETNSTIKMLKSKDKDIYNLERKSDKLNDTIERLRIEVGTLKAEKVKLQKELKNHKKKAEKETKKQIPPNSMSSVLSTSSSLLPTLHTPTWPTLHTPTLPTSMHSNLVSTATCVSSLQSTSFTSTTSSLYSSMSFSTTSNNHSTLTMTTPSNLHSSLPISSAVSSPRSMPDMPIHNPIHPWHSVPLSIPERAQLSSRCEHPTQCILRQPRPPPLPSITYLYNDRSKYHEHMMTWPADEFAGCRRCFSVDNENYGCGDCQWLKWWLKWHGELHGYPDVSPWIYKRYL